MLFLQLIQFLTLVSLEQKSHFVHGKRPLLKPPPPLTAIAALAVLRDKGGNGHQGEGLFM